MKTKRIAMQKLHFFFIFLFISCLISTKLRPQSLEGKPYTDSLQQVLSQTKEDTSRIKVLYSLSNQFVDNDSVAALKYARQCLQLSQKINWQKGIGLAYRAYGSIYYALSDYGTSIQYFKKGLSIFQSLHDRGNAARLLSNMGDVYSGTGLFTQALENYLASLKLFEEINYSDGISSEYNNIGIVYYNLLEYDKSIEYYNKSLQIDLHFTNKFAIASDYDNIASVYLDEGKFAAANNYNEKAIPLFAAINDQPALARAYINRGNILLKQHDASSAYDFYNRSLAINRKLNITNEIASCYAALGNLYVEWANDSTKQYKTTSFTTHLNKQVLLEKANNYLLAAFTLGKKENYISRLMNYSSLLSTINKQIGNYKAALHYHEQYSAYKDSIFNDANRKKVETMEQERRAEIKDQQIQLLQQQKTLEASEFKRKTLIKNIILLAVTVVAALVFIFIILYNRRKKIQFDKQVMEVELKALRAQMNPHFIFNSLHSINNYVTENDKENASVYLLKFAKLMRFILENSRAQEISVETDLQALELYMQMEALQSKKTFSYHIQTDPQIDSTNTLIPPMLLQPFVENAILHGIKYKENGYVQINIRKQDEMICFEIEDNGRGLSSDIANADNHQKHISLARKIIDERLQILNHLQKTKATVTISNITNSNNKINGVSVILLLPLKLAF